MYQFVVSLFYWQSSILYKASGFCHSGIVHCWAILRSPTLNVGDKFFLKINFGLHEKAEF